MVVFISVNFYWLKFENSRKGAKALRKYKQVKTIKRIIISSFITFI